MRIAALLVPLSLLAALLIAACGDSGPSTTEVREADDREQIEAVAEEFASAVETRNARAFCKLLAPADKDRLRYEGRRCLVVWGPRHNPLFKAEDPDLSVKQITKLDVPTATVRLANGGHLVFVKKSGDWYVSLAPQGKG